MSRRARFVSVLAVVVVSLLAALAIVFLLVKGGAEEARSSSAASPQIDRRPSESKEAGAQAPAKQDVSDERRESMRQEISQRGVLGALGGKRSYVVEKNGARRVDCEAACAVEEQCGLRDTATCRTLSCEADGVLRVVNRADFCMGDADTCGDAVMCTCEESCWRRGECTGDHHDDKQCTQACKTITAQSPRAMFVENRCVLESACKDLAACAVVQPEREMPMPARQRERDSSETLLGLVDAGP